MIFSRKSGSGRHAKDDTRASGRRRRLEERAGPRSTPSPTRPAPPSGRPEGPYDVTEAPARASQRLDLGACRCPRSTAWRSGSRPTRRARSSRSCSSTATARCSSASSPRRAPRASGTRSAPRSRKRCRPTASRPRRSTASTASSCAARVRTPDGPTDVRFVGIDGPRWMVRARLPGRGRGRPGRRAGRCCECLRGLVVDRGDEASRSARRCRCGCRRRWPRRRRGGTPRTRRDGANGARGLGERRSRHRGPAHSTVSCTVVGGVMSAEDGWHRHHDHGQ